MRYQVRWSNGYWKTFDAQAFADVELHSTKVEAERDVEALNAKIKRAR